MGSASPAEIAADVAAHPKAEDRTIKQCQNVASHMIQKNALMHSQAAYWVSIVVVVGRLTDLQDALAVHQAAGPAELGAELRPLLRDFISCLAVLRRHLLGARHAADPLHALDAGRALVDDDLHVRRGAGLSFFFLRLDGAGARARRVEGREDNSDATTPP